MHNTTTHFLEYLQQQYLLKFLCVWKLWKCVCVCVCVCVWGGVWSHVSVVLQEHLVVVVAPQRGVDRQPLEKHLVHGHRLLEGGQVLPVRV